MTSEIVMAANTAITTNLMPALIFMVGGMLVPFFKGRAKSVYMLLIPVVGFLNLIHIPIGDHHSLVFGDFNLVLLHVDRLSLVFGYIFHIVAFITVIYILGFKNNVEYVAGFFYAGAALGTIFAGDLFTFFIFWESLTIGSVVLIWSNRTAKAQAAGFRYFMIHVFAGLLLLAGIVLHYSHTGSLEMSLMTLSGPGSWLMFFGIGINSGWPILHPWIKNAYPEATIGGTVFLSSFTTKTAVYALARLYPGTDILIWIGVSMAAFPIFYAVIENDLRRVLAYSLINQMGFMVVGIGIGTELAINGVCAHAFCHILYKALLFMSTGSVLHMTGKIKCTELGGLYKTMPLTCLFCIVGAASISAFPLFSGFVSKSMVMSAVAHMSHDPGQGALVFVWLVLLFAAAGVFHHAGIKVPFFAFFGHDAGYRGKEAPLNMLIAMGIAAFLCVFIGIFPKYLYSVLPFPVDYEPYSISHVLNQTQLLFFSALAFCLLLLSGIYPAEQRAENLDSGWFYRKGGKHLYIILDHIFNPLNNACEKVVRAVASSAAVVFKDAPARIALFVSVNIWLLFGIRGRYLKLRKLRLYIDVMEGTMPIGLGAATAVGFVILVYILT